MTESTAPSVAAPAPLHDTRLIVKGLPKHCDERRLRKHFETHSSQVTDVKVMRTKDGKPRQFGFVGFRSAEAAEDARSFFQSSYIDTSRITLETARKIGDDNLARPWSRHSKGSSAWSRAHPEEAVEDGNAAPARGGSKRAQDGAASGGKNGAKPNGRSRVHSDPKLAEFLALMQPGGQLGVTTRRSHRAIAHQGGSKAAGAGGAAAAERHRRGEGARGEE